MRSTREGGTYGEGSACNRRLMSSIMSDFTYLTNYIPSNLAIPEWNLVRVRVSFAGMTAPYVFLLPNARFLSQTD